ncbi:MAG: hypothetical protein KJO79_07870, partial [Verrucomicrobiae bacterium]|nr:hypothetical protein [Verrucomicrobiae bacterium]NNJ87082.1 hypothetical protein [Akkermansiaceae bacterium]
MSSPNRLPNAWLSKTIKEFLSTEYDGLLGEITKNSSLSVELEQRDAWREQFLVLRESLCGVEGDVFFELTIPRLGKRIDTVVITKGRVFVLEFKVGSKSADKASVNQVWDYALDLKNFHEGSHDAEIIPILIPSNFEGDVIDTAVMSDDGVR